MNERSMDLELAELNDLILKMGNSVESSIAACVEALRSRSEELSRNIISGDSVIDDLENEIDDKCISILARRQPLANDLRFIATAMKITTDIERIGDLSVDIAQKNLELISMPLLKPLIDIPKLGKLAQEMISKSLDSFIKRDVSHVKQIHEMEKMSDNFRNLITDELMDIMAKDCTTVPRAIPLLLIARFLERICDHAMNIAEDVVFMVEGRVIKHLHVKKQED